MKKRSLFKALAAIFVGWMAALAGVGSATAASITQTFNDPLPSGAATLVLPFNFAAQANSFDTSLGTLTSVVITVTTRVAGSVQIISLNQTPPNGPTSSYSNAGDQTNVHVTGPGGLNETYVAQTNGVSGTVNNPTPTQIVTVTTRTGLTGSTTASQTITGAGLIAYETPPSMNTVTLNYTAGPSTVMGTGNVAFQGNATAGATLSITYNYIAAVPEPASMSLLGIGMAGFFAFRRFFNKRNADV
jgi:hypothetical protein